MLNHLVTPKQMRQNANITRCSPMTKKSLLIVLLVVAGCASEVPRSPSPFSQMSAQSPVHVIQLESDIVIDVGTGYSRMLPRGTVLKRTGTVTEGDVYKPINYTLTLEGANIHEVHLVLKDLEVMGFYMPVEKAFVLPKNKITARFSTRG